VAEILEATALSTSTCRTVRDEALTYLNNKNVKCFYLSTSYGLSGWVLATGILESTIEA
jgi:hypothetical protein